MQYNYVVQQLLVFEIWFKIWMLASRLESKQIPIALSEISEN